MTKTSFLIVIGAVLVAAVAGAQSLPPVKGDFGLGASVSTSSQTLQAFYDVTDSLVLVPKVGAYHYNYADTVGGATTNYPGTWYQGGIGIFYVVHAFSNLSLQVGPSFTYSSESYQANLNPDNLQFTYWSVSLDLRPVAMINKNLGVFTNFGVQYYSQDTKDKTSSADTLITQFQLISPSLGVVYYFK